MDWQGRRVLVTGSSGFIGTHLCRRLEELQAGVVRLPGRGAGVDPARAVRDAAPDFVFHLAAETSSDASVESHRSANVGLTAAMLRGASGVAGLRAFVHVGTCAEYGAVPSPLCEDGPCEPVDAYGRTKLEATRLAMDAAAGGLPVVAVRPFLTFGPGQRAPRLLALLASAVAHGVPLDLTAGRQTRDVVFVDDVVEVLIVLAGTPSAFGHVVNVASGIPRCVEDLARAMLQAAGVSPERSTLRLGARPYRPGEPMEFFADVTRQRRLVGFTERTPLPEALARTLAWHRGQPPLPELRAAAS